MERNNRNEIELNRRWNPSKELKAAMKGQDWLVAPLKARAFEYLFYIHRNDF